MYSAEGEEVQLSFSVYPSNNVEVWLLEVEGSMKASVRDIIEQAIKAYPTVSAAFPLSSLQSDPSSVPLFPSPPPPPEARRLLAAVFLREHWNLDLERPKRGQGRGWQRLSQSMDIVFADAQN